MFKELLVQVQEVVITTKNDIESLQPLPFLFKDGCEKLAE
jgi:hypothetical protein